MGGEGTGGEELKGGEEWSVGGEGGGERKEEGKEHGRREGVRR